MNTHTHPMVGHIHLTVSEAIYLRDPDNNGVEIYVDRPKETWKVSNDGMVEMVTEVLNIEDILKELA